MKIYDRSSSCVVVDDAITFVECRKGKQQQNQARGGCSRRRPHQGPVAKRQSETISSILVILPPYILQAISDAEAYSVVAAAKAQAQKLEIEAEAQARATRLAAEAEAESVRVKAAADAQVHDQFAREMELRRVEVSRVKAFGSNTIFVPTDGMGAQMGGAMATGLAAGMGADARR